MALFDNATFAPQTYQGGQGGLLGSILAMLQANPQASQGFPQADPAQLPVNAQPTQGQAPQQMRPQYPSMPEPSLQAGSQPMQQPQMQSMPQGGGMGSIGSGMGGDFLGALMPGRMKALRDAQMPHQAEQMLASQGMNPMLARVVANNPTLLAAAVGSQLGLKDRTNDVKEYEYAKSQGYKGTLLDWMSAKRAGAGEYGLQPIWGQDDQGNPVMLQAGKSGEAVRSKIPDGVSLRGKDALKLDAGTHWVLIDPLTRQQVGIIPKDVAGKERQEAVGKSQGEASQIVPQVETTVNNAIKTIGELRSHPGIDVGTGLASKIHPQALIPGRPGYDFIEKNKTAQGQAFMAAREALKGAGQVTDFEGKKGEEAITNLNTAQSKKQYLDALDNLERMMKQSVADLKKKAGLGAAAPQSGGNDPLGLR